MPRLSSGPASAAQSSSRPVSAPRLLGEADVWAVSSGTGTDSIHGCAGGRGRDGTLQHGRGRHRRGRHGRAMAARAAMGEAAMGEAAMGEAARDGAAMDEPWQRWPP